MNDTARRRVLAAAFFVAGAWFVWQQEPADRPVTMDNQIYFYIADRAAAGVPPHVSLVDHKQQLSSLLQAAAIAAAAPFGIDSVYAMRAASLLFAALAVMGVFVLAAELAGTSAGILAGFVTFTYTDFFTQAAVGGRPQLFMETFVVWALVAFARRRDASAGALSLCAYLCWQPALLALAAVGLASLAGPDRWRRAARVTAGAVVAAVVYESYFLWHGVLGEQLYQTWILPADVGTYSSKPLAESLRFVLRMGLWRNDSQFVFPLVFLAAMVFVFGRAVVRGRGTLADVAASPTWSALWLLSLTATAFTLASHQAYPDMFVLHPLVAVVFGTVAARVVAWIAAQPRPRIEAAVLAGVAVVIALFAQTRTTIFRQGRVTLDTQRRLAAQVDLMEDAYGPVWAIGCPHLLALLGKDNHTRYGLLIDPKVRNYMTAGAGPEGYRPSEADGGMPGVILTARGGERHVLPWLRVEYDYVHNKSFREQGIHVYVRRSAK